MTHTITRTVKLNQPTQAYRITGRGRNKTAHEIPVSKALNDVRRLITLIHDEVQSRLTLTQAYEDKAKINDYQAWAREIDTERDRGTTNQIVQEPYEPGYGLIRLASLMRSRSSPGSHGSSSVIMPRSSKRGIVTRGISLKLDGR